MFGSWDLDSGEEGRAARRTKLSLVPRRRSYWKQKVGREARDFARLGGKRRKAERERTGLEEDGLGKGQMNEA